MTHRGQKAENVAQRIAQFACRACSLGHLPRTTFRIHRVPVKGLAGRHFPDKVHPHHTVALLRPLHHLFGRHHFRREAGLHGPAFTQMLGQSPRVDFPNARDSMTLQVIMQGFFRPPIARCLGQFLDDKTPHLRPPGLFIEHIDAVVANMRIRHGHDLSKVRGIGQHLLVSAHGRVEAHFSRHRGHGTKCLPAKNPPVFKCQNRRHDRTYLLSARAVARKSQRKVLPHPPRRRFK